MALARNAGKLILRDGKLATGQECCCGEPCDPCNGGLPSPIWNFFRGSRMVGTWDTGDGPVAFDWLAPAGPYVWLNVGWENNSRPPAGMAAVAPFVGIYGSYWRWDGSTETCNIYVDGEIAEGEVPALRTCGGEPCPASAYGRYHRTLIENPPPSDNKWYQFMWIYAVYNSMDTAEPDAWYWAWIPACDLLCGEQVSLSSGVRTTVPASPPGLLEIDTFTITCEQGAPCCTGNAEYPVFELPSACAAQGGHSWVWYENYQSTPLCAGACCYNNGTADVCGEMLTLAQCNALGGTWHSGQDCFTDPCNLFP